MTPREIQKIATENLGLVRKIAWKFSIPADAPFTIDDLIAEGTIGLMKVIPKFDSSKGFAFSSYATPYIKGEIQHFLAGKINLVKHRRGGPKTVVHSLDRQLNSDGETTFLDTIAYDEPPEEDSRKAQLDQMMLELPKNLRDVLLMQQQGLSNQDIANWQGVSLATVGIRLSEARRELQKTISEPSNFKPKKLGKRTRSALPYKTDGVLHVPPFRRNCAFCGVVFGLWEVPRIAPQNCSGSCAQKSGLRKSGKSPWSEAEIKALKALIGNYPTVQLIEKFTEICIARQWPKRTPVAIEVKIDRLAKSIKPVTNGWSMRSLARQLGVPTDRVRLWKRKGLICGKVPGGPHGQNVIERKDLIDFCKANIHWFSGIDTAKLAEIFRDKELAEQCAAQRVRVKRQEVQRLDTKQVYPSVRAAEKALGISRVAISRDIKRTGEGWLKQSHTHTIGQTSDLTPTTEQLQQQTRLIDPARPIDNIKYLKSPTGINFETNNVKWFCEVHGIRGNIWGVLTGRQRVCAGWTIGSESVKPDSPMDQARKPLDLPTRLTPQQTEVLSLLTLSNREIGAKLNISPRTVESVVYAILKRTGMTRIELLKFSKPQIDPSDLSALSQTEHAIIPHLHLSTREIAAKFGTAERTIEIHLIHIYRKTGASRWQLIQFNQLLQPPHSTPPDTIGELPAISAN